MAAAGSQTRRAFAGIRIALIVLVVGLGALAVVRALTGAATLPWLAVVLALAFEAVFLVGAASLDPEPASADDGAEAPAGEPGRPDSGGASASRRRRASVIWLVALTVLWVPLVLLVPDAAYLAFPLFFLFLHLLPGLHGPAAVVTATAAAIAGLALHHGLSVGGVAGPIIGALVAVAVSAGYRAIRAESEQRRILLDELIAAQDRLAETERLAGREAERARVGAELHDTVAQGLSSIIMLLTAAQRTDPAHPAAAQIDLAAQTAGESLAETRRVITSLTAPQLEHSTLSEALRRIVDASRAGVGEGIRIEYRCEGDPSPLPRPVETTLLRVAQGLLANALTHARARGIVVTLTFLDDEVRLDVVDDGVGFDPAAAAAPAPGSFGLRTMEERISSLGGQCEVETAPGRGTAVSAAVPLEPRAPHDEESHVR